MEDPWKDLTDPILLTFFSFLNVQELNNAARTCKNWYRVAHDESLWKNLTFKRLGRQYLRKEDSWKLELKRLTCHVPVHLHQTCTGHVDEVYNVCFSNSGCLIATCGADGIVNIWKYGIDTVLLHSKKITNEDGYVNYVEFNDAETHLLVHSTGRNIDFQSAVAVLSIEREAMYIVAARYSGVRHFRGTWLNNETFLNVYKSDLFPPYDVELIACKFYEGILDEDDCLSSDLRIPDYFSKQNVDTKKLLKMEQVGIDPDFVKVIDWSEWNQGFSNEPKASSTTDVKVIALYIQRLYQSGGNGAVFYKVSLDSLETLLMEPIKTVLTNSACLGVQLSANHRYVVYNLRRLSTDGSYVTHEKDVVTMVISLENTEEQPDLFCDPKPADDSLTISYFFPSVSDDLVANESEPDVVFLWDRHSHEIVSRLYHHTGVSAVAFHPRDQEVLASVADDKKLRIWMSTNRKRNNRID
ncbi:F-box/WD repeat-containing protein 5-like [Saccostrea echinata]|uniref:F-box/WD repeat-containing protein 5-like n=1 Tax=Saccostrea echinata TaxID=191078 RepID=UPI002A828E01|nr:F-box/WD repeat-containing protein 5-like [Saccostrea echinata]XP_061198105.1 F-box/WD repeat-containing protein 5-like [Saccostrea echinata]